MAQVIQPAHAPCRSGMRQSHAHGGSGSGTKEGCQGEWPQLPSCGRYRQIRRRGTPPLAILRGVIAQRRRDFVDLHRQPCAAGPLAQRLSGGEDDDVRMQPVLLKTSEWYVRASPGQHKSTTHWMEAAAYHPLGGAANHLCGWVEAATSFR